MCWAQAGGLCLLTLGLGGPWAPPGPGLPAVVGEALEVERGLACFCTHLTPVLGPPVRSRGPRQAV